MCESQYWWTDYLALHKRTRHAGVTATPVEEREDFRLQQRGAQQKNFVVNVVAVVVGGTVDCCILDSESPI